MRAGGRADARRGLGRAPGGRQCAETGVTPWSQPHRSGPALHAGGGNGSSKGPERTNEPDPGPAGARRSSRRRVAQRRLRAQEALWGVFILKVWRILEV